MLKFLDFARLVGAGIKCTACNGTRCRQSKWRSKHERLSFIGYRPYRCDDCDNRFFAASSASLERTLINSAAYALLVFAGLVVVELWRDVAEAPVNEPAKVAAVAPGPAAAGPGPASVEVARWAEGPPRVGNEPPVDQALNVKLLNKAAANGHTGAMIRLAQILATGENYPRDARQAAKWMQLAAAAGSPQGMYELGRYYRDGIGLTADSVRAYVWLSRAATARHIEAAHERNMLVRTMSEDQLTEAHTLALAEQ